MDFAFILSGDRGMKLLLAQILLTLPVCTDLAPSEPAIALEQIESTFKPTSARRIMHSAIDRDKILLMTREYTSEGDYFGCFTFDENNKLQDTRIFRLKKHKPTALCLDLYAFGRAGDVTFGGISTIFHPREDYLWFTQMTKPAVKQPQVILRDKTDSLGQWWLLKVGKSKKLFILKSKVFPSKDPETALKGEDGLLHCYNLDNPDKPELEGVTRIENDTTRSLGVECAGGSREVYIWQTTYKEGELLSKRTLRVARWRSDGKLEWITYETAPLVHFVVDYSDGSTALVIEPLEKIPSEEGLPKSEISLVKANSSEITKVGTFAGHYILPF
jgi:hypothetical protein